MREKWFDFYFHCQYTGEVKQKIKVVSVLCSNEILLHCITTDFNVFTQSDVTMN